MQTKTIKFRGKDTKVGYQLSDLGITITSVQFVYESLDTNLSKSDRNEIIIKLLTK